MISPMTTDTQEHVSIPVTASRMEDGRSSQRDAQKITGATHVLYGAVVLCTTILLFSGGHNGHARNVERRRLHLENGSNENGTTNTNDNKGGFVCCGHRVYGKGEHRCEAIIGHSALVAGAAGLPIMLCAMPN